MKLKTKRFELEASIWKCRIGTCTLEPKHLRICLRLKPCWPYEIAFLNQHGLCYASSRPWRTNTGQEDQAILASSIAIELAGRTAFLNELNPQLSSQYNERTCRELLGQGAPSVKVLHAVEYASTMAIDYGYSLWVSTRKANLVPREGCPHLTEPDSDEEATRKTV